MAKSKNKTSAAIERLAGYGTVKIDLDAPDWLVSVSHFAKSWSIVTVAKERASTLDHALNATLRKLEDGDNEGGR